MNKILFLIQVSALLFSGQALTGQTVSLPDTLRQQIRTYLETRFMPMSACPGKTFASFRFLGKSDEAQPGYVYLWVYKACFVRSSEALTRKNAVSLPVRLSFAYQQGKRILTVHDFPGEGTDFSKDVRTLFPPEIQKYIFGTEKYRRDIPLLEKQTQKLAEEFFSIHPAGRPYDAGISWHQYDFEPAGICLTCPESWNRDTTSTSVKIRPLGLQIFPWKEGAAPLHPVFSANRVRLDVYTGKPGIACSTYIHMPEKMDNLSLFRKEIGVFSCTVLEASEGAAGTIYKNRVYIFTLPGSGQCVFFDLNYSFKSEGVHEESGRRDHTSAFKEKQTIRLTEEMIRLLKPRK
ncbi:MAG: hypothetical protein J7K46_02765 [Bacteroidales bacterium]|nr:hypothetical protein [Bacteroidales bacterium]